ncbi:LPS export ABC transporter periplasmic protein LptC [Luteimonas chenhongjianii]|uniref:Lipopolysaccharide export system protein LptC n=1 Tax=Luteimonas chenhongjianii TaxID=2006110 RepID=A0A290XI92_9GAMM|nr:LPS export ABC transporter periplasmic protein LptC [Luteimonas chenhongjianii]
MRRRQRPLAHPRRRRSRRRARTVRSDPACAGTACRHPRRRTDLVNWRLTLTVVLLLGALVSGWSVWRQNDSIIPEDAADGRTDYLLRDFDIVALNNEGREAFSLQAPELQQTPGARTLELVTPLFLIPESDGEGRWTVRAKTGWVSESNDEVRLRGEVVADSPEGYPRPTRMRTEALNVFPQRNHATSDVLVDVVQPGFTMQGTGMRADLDSGRIELLSEVKLRNEPNSRR